MKLNRQKSFNRRGFSLVEMLVVIAVIGVIAGIAVPMLGNITEKADKNKSVRNAQMIASMYTAAVSAGAEISGTTASDIADEIIAGVSGSQIEGSFFQARMTEEERNAALAHLTYDETMGILLYAANGGSGVAAGAMSVGDLDPGILTLGGTIAVFQELEDGAGNVEYGQTYVEAMLGYLASQAAYEQDLAAGNEPFFLDEGSVTGNLSALEMAYHDLMAGGMFGEEGSEEQLNDARAAYYEARDLVLQEAVANQSDSQFILPYLADPYLNGDPLVDPMGEPVDPLAEQATLLAELIANDNGFGSSNVVLTQVQPGESVFGEPGGGIDDPGLGIPENYNFYAFELQQ